MKRPKPTKASPRKRKKKVVPSADQPRLKLCYLFTTFPLVSETFLQREIRVMKEQHADLTIYSLYGGGGSFEGMPVHRFRLFELFLLVYWLPYWLIVKPGAIASIFRRWFTRPPRYFTNLEETFLGEAFALIRAHQIRKLNPDLIHGVWATMPATAALTLEDLIGTPFSMGAHAYDVFKKGGDCLLPEKALRAKVIHSSTRFARRQMIRTGAPPSRIHWIRRGLSSFPPVNTLRPEIDTIRILTVGRLVPKKGYLDQVRIYSALRKRGIPFEARIVGAGPLKEELEESIQQAELSCCVSLHGGIPHDQVQDHYAWCDLFIFTGVVDDNGDRNGLANVIPEALSRGIPVIATPDSGILENFKNDVELIIQTASPADQWVKLLMDLASDFPRRERLGKAGREWTEKNFDAHKNSSRLFKLMQAAVAKPTVSGSRSKKQPMGDQA